MKKLIGIMLVGFILIGCSGTSERALSAETKEISPELQKQIDRFCETLERRPCSIRNCPLKKHLRTTTISEIKTPTLENLFPNHRFFLIHYKQIPHPKEILNGEHIARLLYCTIAINTAHPGDVYTFWGYGNYKSFGPFLNLNKIILKNETDAQHIWNAFCDIHARGSKSQRYRRTGSQRWKLGIYINRDNNYKHYYLVHTDKKGQVLDWKSIAIKLRKDFSQPLGGEDGE